MNFRFIHLPLYLACLTYTFQLSGCATIDTLSFLNNPDQESVEELQTGDSVENDQDLVETEPLMCLNEELTELDLTGLWESKPDPVSVNIHTAQKYDFPVVYNKQVEMYLKLFQGKQRRQFGRWLARSGKYRELMTKELRDAGLPQDLMYLSMIESGYYELAYSHSKAVGLWQFMKGTGRQYNLKINKYVDERRDPEKATKAAVAYLADLYKEFGDWHLAVAAYNGGPGTIRCGLKRHDVDNFWDLASEKHLRLETKRYVPKLIAALIIAKNPERYGFGDVEPEKPLKYDTITVGPGMSLSAIALISDSTEKKIKELNHELRRGKTPANIAQYEVKVPASKGLLAQKNISRLHSIASTGYKTHIIRKGETLTQICNRYDVNKTTLLKVNNLRSNSLTAGRNLRIPYSTITYRLLPEGSSDSMAAYKDSLVLHRIKKGDTISSIAKKYHVPANMIVSWNGLKNAHSIRAGQQLALYIDKGGASPASSHEKAIANFSSDVVVLQAYKKKRPGSIDTDFRYYSVQDGDSLWSISRKFSASLADLKRWNNLKSNMIHPGSTLKLKQG